MGFVDEFEKATEGAPSREAMEAQEQAVLDLLLGKLRGEAAASAVEFLRAQRDEARREVVSMTLTLAAIRDALGCEPGDEVEAAERANREALRWMRQALGHPFGRGLRPGDTLNPADFGKGEAGVLRLAALLSEAPEGAVVQDCEGEQLEKGAHGVWESDGYRSGWAIDLAERAPLTVVAWPS